MRVYIIYENQIRDIIYCNTKNFKNKIWRIPTIESNLCTSINIKKLLYNIHTLPKIFLTFLLNSIAAERFLPKMTNESGNEVESPTKSRGNN